MATSPKSTPGITIAAIDLGSNAVRLEIGRLQPGRVIEILCDEREPARLGREVFRTGELSVEAREKVLEALTRFATLIRRFKPDFVRAVATSAMREASNYDVFVRTAKARTGIDIDVISGGEEARLLCLGALGASAQPDREALVIDVGGGSTEIAVAKGSEVVRAKSLPLGTVRLTEVFLKNDPPKKKQLKLMREYVREILKSRVEKDLIRRFPVAIACAGTAGAIAAIVRGEPGIGSAVAPPHVRREEVRALLTRLAPLSIQERARIPGLDASRADVFLGGVAIIDGLMDFLQLDELEVSKRGIRDGVMIDTLRRQGLWDAEDPDRALFDAVEVLGRRCGFDFAHARQVHRISLKMFDALQGRVVDGGPKSLAAQRARRVLGVAAMLHDIGTFISYAKHHKHSAYLIANAEVPGLTETEKILASNVARYHRRAHPRDRHPEFVVMPPDQRELVRKLASIVRLADGLDRTHDGRVRELTFRTRKTGLEIGVASSKDLELELWAVRQKAALFQEAFGTEVVFKPLERTATLVKKRKSLLPRRS